MGHTQVSESNFPYVYLALFPDLFRSIARDGKLSVLQVTESWVYCK